MDIYAALLSIVCIFTVYLKVRSSRVLYLRNLLIPTGCILLILCLVAFSKTAVKSAFTGLNLWLTVVFPSLFPFFVTVELLNGTRFVQSFGRLLEPVMRPLFNVPGCGSFALAMGVMSGYPTGARIIEDLRRRGMVSRIEAERLLTFTNNSSPLFIVGAVATGMLKMPGVGLLLLGCHIAACLTTGFLFRFYHRSDRTARHPLPPSVSGRPGMEIKSKSFGNVFGDAVKNSVMVLLAIGGFIVFFSVIINILLETGLIGFCARLLMPVLAPLGLTLPAVSSIISGIFEITTGSNMASQVQGLDPALQLAVVSLVIGWGGFSVHSQVASIVSDTDIRVKPYLAGKLLQGIFAAAYCYLAIKITGLSHGWEKPAFASFSNLNTTLWQNYLLGSLLLLLATVLLLLMLAFALRAVRKKGRTKHYTKKGVFH